MALELLKLDYGDINDDDDDEVEESSLSAEEANGEISNLRIFDKELAQERVQEEMGIAQMTNERARGNNMGLELAIQMEFEFRPKIERLKLCSPRYDLEEPQIAVQVTVTAFVLVYVKSYGSWFHLLGGLLQILNLGKWMENPLLTMFHACKVVPASGIYSCP